MTLSPTEDGAGAAIVVVPYPEHPELDITIKLAPSRRAVDPDGEDPPLLMIEQGDEGITWRVDEISSLLTAISAAAGLDHHIVELREENFGLQHPYGCRPDLLGCAVSRALEATPERPFQLGTWLVELEDGALRFKDVPR